MSNEEVTVNHDVSKINAVTEHNKSMNSGLNRFGMFQFLVRNAFERISSGVSVDNYINLFGGLIKKSKSAPIKMHSKMKTKLMESLNSEITLMVEDEQIEEKFNKLESLVDEYATYEGIKTWRPNGDVNNHVRTYIMEGKLKHKFALEEYVREREQSTEMLKQQVSELRAQVCEAETILKGLSLDTSVCDRVDKKITEQIFNL